MTTTALVALEQPTGKLTAALNKLIKGERAWLERPFVLANMLYENKAHQGVEAPTYEDVSDAYLGLTMSGVAAKAVAVEEALRQSHAQGIDRMEVGNDIYVSAVEPREVDGIQARALLFEGQNRDYLLVLNRKSDKDWDVHVRRIWRDYGKAMRDGRCSSSLLYGGELTPHDVLRLAEEATKYSDDIQDGKEPVRPSYLTYMKGSLIARSVDASVGLKFGDFRDPGYVVSMKVSPFTGYPEVEKGVRTPFGDLEFVMTYLEYAAQCFGLPADPRIG
jgi:hypothetical protein